MNVNLDLLLKIQEVDLRLDRLLERRAVLPRKIDDLEESKESINHRFQEQVEEHNETDHRRRKEERDLDTIEEKIAKLKSQLHMVKTNREYQALLSEIATLEESKGKFEEEILLLMEESAAGEVRLQEMKDRVKEELAGIDRDIEEVHREVGSVEREIQAEEKLKQELVSQVDDNYYRRYQLVRQRRGSDPVSPIINAICQGCHMEVPPQLYVEIKKGGEIRQCPACQRILYWPGEGMNK